MTLTLSKRQPLTRPVGGDEALVVETVGDVHHRPIILDVLAADAPDDRDLGRVVKDEALLLLLSHDAVAVRRRAEPASLLRRLGLTTGHVLAQLAEQRVLALLLDGVDDVLAEVVPI